METVDLIQSIGIIVSILIGVISVIIGIRQMRIQAQETRASVDASIADRADRINSLMFEHPEVYAKFDEPYDPDHEADRRRPLMFLMCINFEQVFVQRMQYKNIEDEDWDAWVRTMEKYFQKPYTYSFWKREKYAFHDSFQKFVDDSILNQSTGERKQLSDSPSSFDEIEDAEQKSRITNRSSRQRA